MRTSGYYIKLAYLLGKYAANLDPFKALFKERSGALARMTGQRGAGRRMAIQKYWPAEMQQANRPFITRPIPGVGAPPPGYGVPRRNEDIRKRIKALQAQAQLRQMGAVNPTEALPGVHPTLRDSSWMGKDTFRNVMLGH
jgi:hypothetical protein